MPVMLTDRVKEVTKNAHARTNSLKKEYEGNGWKAHHAEIDRYILGQRGEYLRTGDSKPNDGGKTNQNKNNSTPEESVHTTANGLAGSFTNPAIPWLHITPEDLDLADYKPVREFLWRQQSRMYSIYNRTNLYSKLPIDYRDMISFGMSALRFDLHMERTIHFTHYPVGSWQIALGPDGRVDTIAYHYWRTVRTLVQIYGEDGVSRQTREKWNQKSGTQRDTWVKCFNLIEFNDGRDRDFMDWRGQLYRSITAETDTAEDDSEPPLKLGGFDRFPVAIARPTVTGENVYPESMGMRALPEARQLHREEQKQSKGLSKALDPPLNVPAAVRRINQQAGGINRYRGQRADAIRPTHDFRYPYAETQNTIERREGKVERILGANLFRAFEMLDQTGNHQMTIPEIMERKSERVTHVMPLQQSIHQEKLEPIVEATWEFMGVTGELEQMPPELEGQRLRVGFTSQLDLDMRADVTAGTTRFIEWVAAVEGMGFTGAQDNIDVDALVNEGQQGFLTSPQIMRDPGERDEMREAQAQAMEQERAMALQAQEAATAKDLAGAPLGDGNALEAAVGIA